MKYAIDLEKETYEKKIAEKDNHITKLEQDHLYKISEKNEYISKLETSIAKLEAKLEKFENACIDVSKKSGNNSNSNNSTINIVNQTLNLNDTPKIKSFLNEKMDKNVLALGQKGLAKMLSETMLKGVYKCVDASRQNFEFTNENGMIERDVKAVKLTKALINGDICKTASERGNQLWTKKDGTIDSSLYDVYGENVVGVINLDQENSTFRSELSALTS